MKDEQQTENWREGETWQDFRKAVVGRGIFHDTTERIMEAVFNRLQEAEARVLDLERAYLEQAQTKETQQVEGETPAFTLPGIGYFLRPLEERIVQLEETFSNVDMEEKASRPQRVWPQALVDYAMQFSSSPADKNLAEEQEDYSIPHQHYELPCATRCGATLSIDIVGDADPTLGVCSPEGDLQNLFMDRYEIQRLVDILNCYLEEETSLPAEKISGGEQEETPVASETIKGPWQLSPPQAIWGGTEETTPDPTDAEVEALAFELERMPYWAPSLGARDIARFILAHFQRRNG